MENVDKLIMQPTITSHQWTLMWKKRSPVLSERQFQKEVFTKRRKIYLRSMHYHNKRWWRISKVGYRAILSVRKGRVSTSATYAASRRLIVVLKPSVAVSLKIYQMLQHHTYYHEERCLRREEVNKAEPEQLRTCHHCEDGDFGVLHCKLESRPHPIKSIQIEVLELRTQSFTILLTHPYPPLRRPRQDAPGQDEVLSCSTKTPTSNQSRIFSIILCHLVLYLKGIKSPIKFKQ